MFEGKLARPAKYCTCTVEVQVADSDCACLHKYSPLTNLARTILMNTSGTGNRTTGTLCNIRCLLLK